MKPGDWAKQEPLGAALLAMAQELGPGRKMPTVRQLCSQFKVSTSTLDPVLRSLETRGAVIRKHGSGIFVAPTIRQKTVGIVFGGDIFSPQSSPFWGLLLQAVRRQAGDRRLSPRAYMDISDGHQGLAGHGQLLEDLREDRLEGMILLAPKFQYDHVSELAAFGVPLVTFADSVPGWTVTLDHGRAIGATARALAVHAPRRVAFMEWGASSRRGPLLESELRQAGAAGVEVVDWTFGTWGEEMATNTPSQFGFRLALRMAEARGKDPLPDSLVCMDDTMTHGVLEAFRQAGVRPGRDIRVVSTANRGSLVLERDAAYVTQVEFDPADAMRAALEMLEALMNGGTPAHNPVRVPPAGIIG